jgi:hypothetical protein
MTTLIMKLGPARRRARLTKANTELVASSKAPHVAMIGVPRDECQAMVGGGAIWWSSRWSAAASPGGHHGVAD